MTPEDIAETVYIRLSETDDRGEHIRIIAGALKEDRKAHVDLSNAVGALFAASPKLPDFGEPGIAVTNLCRAYERSCRALGESE